MILLAMFILMILMLVLLISLRKRVGPIGKRLILIICILIGLYVLINLALILFFFFGDVSSEEFM